jgi:hypothetical protein
MDEKENSGDSIRMDLPENKYAKNKNPKKKKDPGEEDSEIEDSLLLKIALITGIIGTIALYFVGDRITIGETTLASINSPQEGKVLVKGYVEKVINKNNVVVIDISQKEKITVVVFPDSQGEGEGAAYCSRCSPAGGIAVGDRIEVLGSLSSYKNRTEIIAEQITRVN